LTKQEDAAQKACLQFRIEQVSTLATSRVAKTIDFVSPPCGTQGIQLSKSTSAWIPKYGILCMAREISKGVVDLGYCGTRNIKPIRIPALK
jgi:hypothetical protein